MKKDRSKMYAIHILLFSVYVLLSLLDVDQKLDELPFGGLLGFFIVIIFGLIPFSVLIDAIFFRYWNDPMEEKIEILKNTVSYLKKWFKL